MNVNVRHHGQAVACNALFVGLSSDIVKELHAVSLRAPVRAGEVFALDEGDKPSVYLVSSGYFRRTLRLPGGRRVVGGFLVPGDFVGPCQQQYYKHTIEALCEGELLLLAGSSLNMLCERFPALYKALLARACEQLEDAHGLVIMLARMTASERVATMLLRLAKRLSSQEHGTNLRLPMRRRDVADHLGLTVETVSRVMTQLKNSACIAMHGPYAIQILDMAQLARISGTQSDASGGEEH